MNQPMLKGSRAECESRLVKRWLQANGTIEQRMRLADGVIPHGEILDEIRRELFSAVGPEWTRFERITAKEVCRSHEVQFSAEVCGLTKEKYKRMVAMRDLMPTARIVPRQHMGSCKACNKRVRRKALHVTIEHEGVEFSREFAL